VNIAVLMKQVPDSDEVKLDEKTGTMIREGAGTIINPLDLHAIEQAVQMARRCEGTVTVLSMGPPQTEESLREAMAMGAHKALLATDRRFAGSDSWATSRVLSSLVTRLGGFDLVLAGEKATDGETGQVGPEVASMLDIPFCTYVSEIHVDVSRGGVVATRTVEDGYERQFLPFPCLLTVLSDLNQPSMPTLSGKIRAREASVERVSAAELDIPADELGLNGSPTRVSKVSFPKIQRENQLFQGSSLEEGIDLFLQKCKEMAIL